MASRANRALAGLAAATLLMLGAPATAGGIPSGPIAMAVVDHVGGALQVTETVSQPGSGRYDLWPGAYDVSVPAGIASLGSGYFTVPPGVQSAQVKFYVPFPARGLTFHWQFPTPVSMLWMLIGRGVRLPVILNQKFFTAPGTVWNGSDYSVYSAKTIKNTLLVNLQPAPPAPSVRQEVLPWLWALPVLAIAWLVLRRLRRRRRRYA
jgi:hypothetical protein